MTTNLYDLPKDMLVKMISTIREDTKKEVREEILEGVSKRLKRLFVALDHCSESGCNIFDCRKTMMNDGLKNISYEKLFLCWDCSEVFCDKHIENHRNICNIKYINVD